MDVILSHLHSTSYPWYKDKGMLVRMLPSTGQSELSTSIRHRYVVNSNILF